MVKIYTRKGDDGTTSLWYGGRVPKTNPRTEAYGSIDEANSALGVARALCKADDQADLHATILPLQQDLFVAGAELATAPEAADRLEDGISRITDEMVEALEVDIDRYMDQVDLPPQFVIPGGTELSAALDVARSAIRRAERRLVDAPRVRGPRVGHGSALPEPRLRPRLRPGPLRRRAEPADVRGQEGKLMHIAVARRRQGYEHEIEIREHRLILDEPEDRGGGDQGPKPTELLAASLATCTAITIEMYADRKGWDLGRVEVEVDFTETANEQPAGFDVTLRIPAELDEDQRERILGIAAKCPVHRALAAENVEIEDSLELIAG